MKKILLSLLLLGALALSVLLIALVRDTSATGLTLINSAISLKANYKVSKDIAYSDAEHQQLDIYQPEVLQAKHPVIVFFYGGAWTWGDKRYFKFVADAFVDKGYVVVIPNYVLYPNGKYPDFVQDGAKAIDWVSRNIGKFNGDANQLNVVGHSAGAYIGAMTSYNDSYMKALGSNTSVIKKFAGIGGPYNFTPKEKIFVDVFGEENVDSMKVEDYVNGNEPPSLLLHSKSDTTVGQFNLERMELALMTKQQSIETVLYDEEMSHVRILLNIHPWFAGTANVGNDIHEFLSK